MGKGYYYIDGSKKQGPFSLEELRNMNLPMDTLVGCESVIGWNTLQNVLAKDGMPDGPLQKNMTVKREGSKFVRILKSIPWVTIIKIIILAILIGIPIYTAYLKAEAERLLEQNKDKIERMMREKELEDDEAFLEHNKHKIDNLYGLLKSKGLYRGNQEEFRQRISSDEGKKDLYDYLKRKQIIDMNSSGFNQDYNIFEPIQKAERLAEQKQAQAAQSAANAASSLMATDNRLDIYNKYREASGRNISFDDFNAGMQDPEMRRKVLNYTKNRLGNLGYEIGDVDKAFSNY